MDNNECEMNKSTLEKKMSELWKKIEYYENIAKCEKIIGTLKFGTECFMPLESHLKYKNQNYSVDTWAVGVIFL